MLAFSVDTAVRRAVMLVREVTAVDPEKGRVLVAGFATFFEPIPGFDPILFGEACGYIAVPDATPEFTGPASSTAN